VSVNKFKDVAPPLPHRAPDFDEFAASTGGALALDRSFRATA
jgi:hypothetical protein